MVCNVGGTDRMLRILLGLGVGGAGIYFQSYWGLLGLLFLATGAFRFCPAYLPFRFSSQKGS